MSARRILFVEASTGGVVGGSLTGILHLIPHLDPMRFAPVLALFETKAIALNGLPVCVLPPLPRRTGARGKGAVGRAVARAANLRGVLGTRTRALLDLFRRERPALVYLANGVRANLDGVL